MGKYNLNSASRQRIPSFNRRGSRDEYQPSTSARNSREDPRERVVLPWSSRHGRRGDDRRDPRDPRVEHRSSSSARNSREDPRERDVVPRSSRHGRRGDDRRAPRDPRVEHQPSTSARNSKEGQRERDVVPLSSRHSRRGDDRRQPLGPRDEHQPSISTSRPIVGYNDLNTFSADDCSFDKRNSIEDQGQDGVVSCIYRQHGRGESGRRDPRNDKLPSSSTKRPFVDMYNNLNTDSTDDFSIRKRPADYQDNRIIKKTKVEENIAGQNSQSIITRTKVCLNDHQHSAELSDGLEGGSSIATGVSEDPTMKIPFDELERQLLEWKEDPPERVLEKLTQPRVIHSLKMYAEQENPINVTEIYPIITSALESRDNKEKREILCNALEMTQFMDRSEITTELTDAITRVNNRQSLRKCDGELITSILSLMADFKNVVRADKKGLYISLIKGILSNPSSGYHERENVKISDLLKQLEQDSDADSSSQKANKISQKVHEELRILAERNILPTSMLELRLGPGIEIHKPEDGFENDAHYLRFMFDIYREDFIRPLQTGISNYINHIRTNQTGPFRDSSVRVYTDVRFGGKRCCIQLGILQDVHFDRSQFSCRSLGTSFLQYGNLVCLTDRYFRNIVFAMIGFRDKNMLERGLTSVSLITNASLPPSELVMIESKAFYTAYIHTLKAIQSIARDLYDTYGKLPFRQQLVGLEQAVKETEYSKNTFGSSKNASFRCLLKECPYSSVPLLDTRAWPTQEELGLDSSQYSALRLALTKRLAIIQGPPGTGKTVMGLKIVEFLLNNLDNLFEEKKPILLVSYTNHALDQFLNGVLQFNFLRNCHPADVIRVGSRSEAENLKRFNLNERMRNSDRRPHTVQLRSRLFQLRDKIESCLKEIDNLYGCVLNETFLGEENVISPVHYKSLTEHLDPYYSAMLYWLNLVDEKTMVVSNTKRYEDDYGTIDDEMMREEDSQRMIDDGYRHRSRHVGLVENDIEALSANMIRNRFSLPECCKNMAYGQLQTILHEAVIRVNSNDIMCQSRINRITDVWSLTLDDRWRLYRYWLSTVRETHECDMHDLLQEFDVIHSDYKIAEMQKTINIFMSAKIVAMTTTGAAKYMDVLRKVAPSVVMVEEAAHMSEQHVLGCITASTEHLILIGDHQQLKPQANDYDLSRSHRILEYSLLERLVKSRIDFERLSYQHRMSPEISALVCSPFYRDLKDHESIFQGGKVQGLEKNVVFLDHNEQESTSAFSTSCSNPHEAKFVAHLYKYLRQQGYSYQDITILSLYNDQVRLIRKHVSDIEREDSLMAQENRHIDSYHQDRKDKTWRGVRVISVDNYQGEENKIIILSLVRSNKDGKLGYVKVPNRMCVALTRAKIGLYVIGNLSMIGKRSKLWNEIIRRADDRGIYQTTLGLSCQSHPETINRVRKAEDFVKYSPDGGCNLPCNHQRECGHTCDKKCHNLETLIHDSPCTKVCRKVLCELGHLCQKPCNVACGYCEEKVLKIIPSCGHEVETPCYWPPSKEDCNEKCIREIPCGHKCQRKCGQKCNTEFDCNELVKVTLACGHEIQIACSAQTFPVCTVPCSTQLPCGHTCKGKCGDCSGKRLHIPCEKKCERVLICGHICSSRCSEACPPCSQRCKLKCVHLGKAGCRKRCSEPCIPCREECDWKCNKECKNKYRCSKDCNELCDRPRCDEPCKKKPHRKCKHLCSGVCGEPCPHLCNICDKETLTEIFFGTEDEPNAKFIELKSCGHIFEVSAMDTFVDGVDDSDGTSEIVEKTCPRCKTPIQLTDRYGNAVKKVLNDIKMVKAKQVQKQTTGFRLIEESQKVFELSNRLHFERKYSKVFGKIKTFLDKEGNRRLNETPTLLKSLLNVFSKALNSSLKKNREYVNTLEVHFLTILRWICRQRFDFSDFELQQYKNELKRLSLLAEYLLLQQDIEERTESNINGDERQRVVDTISDLKTPNEKFNIEDAKGLLDSLREKIPNAGLGISDDEKIMIMQAMGFRQKGHWYKCKNNHIYAIGDCGGAMEKAICPECEETIGGERHRLDDDNQVATEMDGAKFSAWSEQANMQNYDLNDDQ